MYLRLENISKSFNKNLILNNININIKKGEIYTILGASGVGKTTILKLIAGILKPDEGKIYLDDIDITNIKTENRCIPFIFQAPLLFPHLNVSENIGFGLKVRKIPKKEISKRVAYLSKLMGIEKLLGSMPNNISGGQQQRVSIARALAPNSNIVLMDEPFSSLNTKLREEMALMIKEIQFELGITIIFVTHNIEESFLISNRAAILIDGQILQEDTPKNLYEHPKTCQVGEFMGDVNLINGKIKQNIFYCNFGKFKTNEEDGKYYMLVRPHQINIKNTDGKYKIVDIKDKGKSIKYYIEIENRTIDIETFSNQVYKCGDKIDIEFPKSSLHFIKE